MRRPEISLQESGEPSLRLRMITGYFALWAGLHAAALSALVVTASFGSGPAAATAREHPTRIAFIAVSFASVIQTYRLLRGRRRSGAIAAAIPVALGIATQMQNDASIGWLGVSMSVFGLILLATVWNELE